MNHLRAFIAGIVVPSIILPLIICIAVAAGKSQVLTIPFVHTLPLIWGIWNILYFAFFKEFLHFDVNNRLLIAGGVLGLLVALYGIFVLDLPSILGISGNFRYFPLIVGPILYAILWRYAVKPLNIILGLKEG